MIVVLDPWELAHAWQVGIARHAWSLQFRAGTKNGLKRDVRADVVGAVGECAAARLLGLYWPATVGRGDAADGDLAGGIEVRTSDGGPGLIAHEWDPDDRPIVLVDVYDLDRGRLQVVGWTLAGDAKVPRYWRADLPAPCYVVKRPDLEPIDSLQRLVGVA